MPDQVVKIEISANVVAWYGAIVATISFIATFILSLLKYLRDRARVKVKVSHGFIAPRMQIDNNLKIFVEAINHGRRTVTLKSAGFSLINGEQAVLVNPENIKFPFELKEGKSCMVYYEKTELLKDVKQQKTKIKDAWFRDATGKIYKTKFKLKVNK